MVKPPRKAVVATIIGERSCWNIEVPSWTTDIFIALIGIGCVKLVLRSRWGDYRNQNAIVTK